LIIGFEIKSKYSSWIRGFSVTTGKDDPILEAIPSELTQFESRKRYGLALDLAAGNWYSPSFSNN
jgi:hypothetical protein